MPRPRRSFEPDVSLHVIHRGNNRITVFDDDPDFELFLVFLKRASQRYGVNVHAFALMTNHYHLIATPTDAGGLAAMMKAANGRYVRFFNKKYARIGTLWNGRYKAIPIQDESYWLTCLRYVELNPVRANIVTKPEAYRWSSYRAHAFGDAPSWIAPHPVYDSLGSDAESRRRIYRELCKPALTPTEVTLPKFHAETALA